MRHVVLLVGLLALVACGGSSGQRGQLYYEATQVRHEPVTEGKRSQLIKTLKKSLDKRKVVWVDKGGKAHTVYPKGEGLEKVDIAALQAMWMASDKKYFGAEFDFMVSVKGKRRRPVTVQISVKGDMRVISGSGRMASKDNAPSPGELRKRYDLGSLKSDDAVDWDKEALQGVDLALALLNGSELDVLKDMPFVRREKSRDKRKGALYVQEGCDAKVLIFNRSLEASRRQFVGSPDKPLPPLTMTTLHEIGHAIHQAPSRSLACDYEKRARQAKKDSKALKNLVDDRNKKARRASKAKGSKRAERVREVEAMDKEISAKKKALEKEQKALENMAGRVKSMMQTGPVLSAYKKALGKKKAPTRYGESSMKESFAESFAIYRADPQALKRSLPKVHAWFEGGGHTKALK